MSRAPRSGKPLPTRHAGPGESLGFVMWRVSNAWQRAMRRALEPVGLTHSQFVLLATSTWFGASEPLTQARLARVAGLDVMTTSQVLRTLEAAGALERRPHPDDPRAKAIAVTADGKRRAARALRLVEAADAAFFTPVAGHERELLALLRSLMEPEE